MDKPEVVYKSSEFRLDAIDRLFTIGLKYYDLQGGEKLIGELWLVKSHIDALCNWWQARRSAPVLDKPTLEALVKRWREKESNHREWAARIPDGPRNAIDLEKSWSYGGCADELEGLLSSAEPSSLTEAELKAIFEFRLAVSEAEDEDVGTVRIGIRHADILRNLLNRMGGTT